MGSEQPGPPDPVDQRDTAAEADRDTVTIRRALKAGVLAWAVAAGAAIVIGLGGGAGMQALPAGIALGLALGAGVASAWLLLAAGLDLLAGEPPSRRRMIWTIAVVIFALFSPLLLVAVPG